LDDESLITTENEAPAPVGTDGGAPEPKKRGKDKSAQSGRRGAVPAEATPPRKPGYTSSSLEETSRGKYKYIIQQKETEKQTKSRRRIVILLLFLLFTILFGSSVWGVMSFVEYNNFRILVDKEGRDYLSLSYSRGFVSGHETLVLDGPKIMSDVTFISMYDNVGAFEAKEGNSTVDADKYLASTFFLKNVSDKRLSYTEIITMANVKLNVDAALRVFLSSDDTGEWRIYAKAKADGSPEEVVPPDPTWTQGRHFGADGGIGDTPWYATPFTNEGTVMRVGGKTLEPGEARRYTIIIWLEGCDPECVNDILGGTLRLQMNFNIE
jgi:hypothetical protein